MKILEVINALNSGGAERFVIDLCNQFAADGHQVTLMILKDHAIKNNVFYLKELSPKVIFISLGVGKCNITTFFKVYKAIKSQECDVMHVHLSVAFFASLSILFDRRMPYILTCHNQAENEKREYFRFFVKKYLYKKGLFDYVAISHQNAESIKMVYGKAASTIIYNGRDKMIISDNEENVKKEIDAFRTSNETKVFVMIARCNQQKNLSRLVRCFNTLKNQGRDVQLLVIGSGYDSPEGQQLQSEAMPHIHFLGPKHYVADYLIHSDFFTLSSDFEGMPITLIESMACGCIPVGTPVSGFNDVIRDGINGFIATDFTDKAYIDALERAIDQKELISKEKLISDYKQLFSVKVCAHRYEDLFTKKIASHHKS